MALVLVTGVSGSIAGACASALRAQGYRVRGTVRSRAPATVSHLTALVPGLELVEADLLKDDGWASAVDGCDFVMHIASPFPLFSKDESAIIKPAVEGTKRVLAACVAAKVKRVVLTSSCAAVGGGYEGTDKGKDGYVFTARHEADWSVEGKVAGYVKSKILAERAAWEAVKGSATELAVVCPSLVQGPMTSARECSSQAVLIRLFDGTTPAVPAVGIEICDMRDVVAAHLAAMTSPKAAGERYIVHSGTARYDQVADVLAARFRPEGFKVTTTKAPYPLLWLASLFSAEARGVLPLIGRLKQYSNAKVQRDLGVKIHTWQEAVVATAESLVAFGSVKKR